MTARARRRRRNGAKSGGTESPRFVGYCRVSKLDQSENGISLVAQAERLRAWAKAYQYRLVKIERDPAISGTVPPERRPGLTAALHAIEEAYRRRRPRRSDRPPSP